VPPDVHPVAGLGFGSAAEAYERGRPSWAPEAVAFLVSRFGLGPGRVVADVAAGTGKLTRLLVASGAEVVAVEPVAGMRRVLAAVLPEVPVVAGVAEALPLRAGAVDAVMVAEAFHWFDVEASLAEVRRILRPGGGLALLWNRAGEDPPAWQVELGRLLRSFRGEENPFSSSHSRAWDELAAAAAGGFTPLERHSFAHRQAPEVEDLVAGALSTSWVAVRPEEERRRVADEVRRLASEAGAPLDLPWRTDVHWCRRR
jgi:SAM-dependent methyltransferase